MPTKKWVIEAEVDEGRDKVWIALNDGESDYKTDSIVPVDRSLARLRAAQPHVNYRKRQIEVDE
jgi:hypothetical protein